MAAHSERAAAAARLPLVLAMLLASRGAAACSGMPTVASASFATARPINTSYAFSNPPVSPYAQPAVMQVFDALAPFTDWRGNANSTYSCVDSRGLEPQLGTFGGDFAELAAAAYIYLTKFAPGQNVDAATKDIFNAFMAEVASPQRPFYYHSSQDKMQEVFADVNTDGVKPEPSIFPSKAPTDQKALDAWLKALSAGKNQGCGHVRLMIDNPSEYGMDSAAVPQALIKAFYQYWWRTPLRSPERSKIMFVNKPGPLSGRAIAIVVGEGCPAKSPAVPPAKDGAQMFVYHGNAVKDLRKDSLAPFFAAYHQKKTGKPLDQTKFLADLEALQGKHLGATLKLLSPANQLPLWTVNIVNTPEPAAPAAAPAPAPKAAQKGGKQKKRGPLPQWLGEVLVFGAFAGMGLAATKYSRQTGQFLEAAGGKAKEAYNSVAEKTGGAKL